MLPTRSPLAVALLAAAFALTQTPALAGPLDPPAGPIAPTPSLEPRTAINATNTPGDANSTFRITQPGSYYLTGVITGEVAKSGIEIAASNVTIDLNGFALNGVPGSLFGIVTDAARSWLIIRNGSVTNWGASGINTATSNGGAHTFENVIAGNNALSGITTGANSVIRGCVASSNGTSGFVTASSAIVTDCLARTNGEFGFSVANAAVLAHCTARDNIMAGITTGSACSITGCSVYGNDGDGIDTSLASMVADCVSYTNSGNGYTLDAGSTIIGCTATSNGANGVRIVNRSIARDNTCSGNTLAGVLAVASDNRIDGNNAVGNARGIDVDAAGNIIVRNTCSGNGTLNWDVVAGNVCLVVNATTAGAISGNAGGSAPGSTDPNANFTY